MEKHARDETTGLLTHGWDESREQKWSDPKTGRSPAFWGRAMGWYAMGLVETLDFIPPDHPRRGELIAIFSAWPKPSRAFRIRRAASGGRSSISPAARRTISNRQHRRCSRSSS